ncbi:gluconate 2-dehydrogenase subunit 3 family protein [Thalassococcus profundi]|uniref:gluconate 2-dehydrogenase subunit 3 family protein n=1 Tax=Thalassococcus profundi TaxID=2282382 RepID=UPI001F2FA53E|nr:gluconate 2-dehydrogenase subunit 3 family protein [Thalassococcus profundi]
MIPTYSRRAVLNGLAATMAASLAPARHAFAQLDDRAFFFLADTQARLLASMCDTLIPKDDFPSASEAGVVDFIDLQLAGPYGQGEGLYLEGPFPEGSESQGYQLPFTPAELMRRGLNAFGEAEPGFADGEESRREDMLTRLSEDDVDLGDVPARAFFDELWQLTNQGYFADPIYGGNSDYAGWRMVGFPGAHAYYPSFVANHNVPYPQPPMGINHDPGGDGGLPRVTKRQEG